LLALRHQPALTVEQSRDGLFRRNVISWLKGTTPMTGRFSAHGDRGPAEAPAPKRNLWKLAASGVLAATVAVALGVAHAAPALAVGGTGDPCSVKDVSVTKLPHETLYVYQVDCPGQPLGWFGGAVTAKYEVIGNWDPQTRTAHEDVYSFDRGQGELDAWTCNEDPWITPAIYPDESGWPNGHTCQLQNQRGGDDWTTDTNPSVSFASVMCFNDPWGVSLEGCWSNDDVTVTGPSAAILRAWNTAKTQRLRSGYLDPDVI